MTFNQNLLGTVNFFIQAYELTDMALLTDTFYYCTGKNVL
jgi:hypothetical protein